MPISAEFAENLLTEIKERQWWQGSLISGSDLSKIEGNSRQSDWWIIASQACNLYNPCFANVPVFEIIAAKKIEACDPGKIRGDNPRVLHIEARSEKEVIPLELNIQNRQWCPRRLLAELPAPRFHVLDSERGLEADWLKKQWLDKFIGWLGRSYNRVALPDDFNDAMRKSKLKDIFERKLTTHKDELYGIYLSLASGGDDHWSGILGKMPPPYLLNIVLVVYEDVDPEQLRKKLLDQLFSEEIKDPENSTAIITRARLAERYKIRLIEADVEAWSVADITLLQLKSLVRYSLVDHLSDSSMAIS